LAVYWDGNPGIYAYYTNGVEKFRGILPLAHFRNFGLNETRLLIADTYISAITTRFTFTAVDLNTGGTNVVESDLGATYSLAFASSGHDFLGVASTIGTLNDYVGKIWVTDTGAPLFGLLTENALGIGTTLRLNPE
jgi:hypothetical protein